MRVHQRRTVTITVSNKGSNPLKIRRTSIRNTAGCRSFGLRCPVRILATSGCLTQTALFGGDHCAVTLAFQPLTSGRLSVTFCADTLGPLGEIAPPTTTRTCIPVSATVLAGHTAQSKSASRTQHVTLPAVARTTPTIHAVIPSSSGPAAEVQFGVCLPDELVELPAPPGDAPPGAGNFAVCSHSDTLFRSSDVIDCEYQIWHAFGQTFVVSFVHNGIAVESSPVKLGSTNSATGDRLHPARLLTPGTYACQMTADGRVVAEQSFLVIP